MQYIYLRNDKNILAVPLHLIGRYVSLSQFNFKAQNDMKIALNIEWQGTHEFSEGCLLFGNGDIEQDASASIEAQFIGEGMITDKHGEFDGYESYRADGYMVSFAGIFQALHTVKIEADYMDAAQQQAEVIMNDYLLKYSRLVD